jgi:hypothetical protein
MGNTQVVLPPGVVCDPCNHGPLARLDKALCEFPGVLALRHLNCVPTKKKKAPPAFRLASGTISMIGADTIALDPTGAEPMIHEIDEGDGVFRLRLPPTATTYRMTQARASRLARAVLKVGYETMWIDRGEAVLDPTMNHVRDAILGQPYAGYFACTKRWPLLGIPDEVTVTVDTYESSAGMHLLAEINYHGMVLLADSRRRTPPDGLDDVANVIPFRR